MDEEQPEARGSLRARCPSHKKMISAKVSAALATGEERERREKGE